MLGDKTVSLVMPCRNEAEFLECLIDEVPDFFDEIICVSNKSTDDTVEVGLRLESFFLLIMTKLPILLPN